MPKRKSPARKSPAPFPTRDQVLEFIRDSDGPVGKREISRAFNLSSTDKVRLRDLLRDLKEEGVLIKDRARLRPEGTLPNVTVIEVVRLTNDGDVVAEPVGWDDEAAEPPTIYLAREQGRRNRHDAAVGDRVLARLMRSPDGVYRARAIKHLKAAPRTIIGVFEPDADAASGAGLIRSTSRRQKYDVIVPRGDAAGAKKGDLVRGEIMPGRGLGPRTGRVIDVLGSARGPGAVSLISIQQYDLPVDFSEAALRAAKAAKPVELGNRTDLRDLPLVTIDGEDARDFDDAVWAAPDDDPNNPGGWQIVVAIADVAHYVRPGTPLDEAAYERGNSVYFPDRVVPMLPEALSNDLCSLRPGEDRACLAAFLWIDRDGDLIRHRFERALMRSAARLTYSQVQAARDGKTDDVTGALADGVIQPLYGAFEVLAAARRKRQALEIDLPERRVILADDGSVASIAPRDRLDSHRLIEEFMICANVAAAETLEKRRQPCMYRIHEPPDAAKLEALRPVLAEFGYSVPKGQTIRAANLNQILAAAAGRDHETMINEAILRAQSQARYAPDNAGHFGLALRRYAHFTSPIRRYADLLVHRSLIGGRERDGVGPEAQEQFGTWGEHISVTERRAMEAERSAVDRYVAAFMADRIGAEFDALITSVTRFGLFVRLAETGADGLVPMRSLPGRYRLNDDETALVEMSTANTFAMGDALTVRLVEANPLTGGLLLDVVGGGKILPRRPVKTRKSANSARRRGRRR